MKPTTHQYESMRLQISKVSELADIGPRFMDAVNTNHLLSMIVKQTLDVMNADACIIWLKDKRGNLVPRMSFGLKTSLIQSAKVRVTSAFVKCIMAKDKPTNIYNLAGDRRVPIKRIIKREDLKSLLAEPLVVGDEKIGVLMVCSKANRRFTAIDLKVFNALTKQSALAIYNIGLYERTDRKVKDKIKEISMLFTMSKSISSSVDLDLLLNLILEKVRVLMRGRYCTLKLLGRSRQKLAVAACAGLSKKGARKLTGFDNEISREVIRSGMPCVINDIVNYLGKLAPAFIRKSNVRALMAVPLFSDEHKIGVLSIYVSKARLFSKEDAEMFGMVASLCSMAIDNATMLERVHKDYLNTIKTLAKVIDANDPCTRGHCDKVMKYSLLICRKLKLSAGSVNAIKTASLLHDIGKIGIDMSIIRKPGKLTPEDWKKIKMHPEIGARIVGQVGFLKEVVPIIRCHHEKFGGGGYPDPKRTGSKIPLGARIIAVADAFDAMTSDRPYRKALPRNKAVEELKKCAGSQFDQEVVKAFIRDA